MADQSSDSTSAKPPDDARERLRQHFLHDRTPDRWDELWKGGTFLPWDRGVPNPALTDALAKTTIIGSPLREDGSRKRALVPGCGKGYDVHLLAAHGYDAYGLEVGNAIEAARKFAEEAQEREEYRAKDDNLGKGKVGFVQGDFFRREWEEGISGGSSKGFDVIYDYTVSSSFTFLPMCYHFSLLHQASKLAGCRQSAPNALTAVPLRHAAQPTTVLVKTHDRAPRSRRHANLPRIPHLQGAVHWWPALGSHPRDVRDASPISRRGTRVRLQRLRG